MERRAYNRISVKRDCVLYHETGIELSGVLTDISEGDIGLKVFDEVSLKTGDICTVQFVDMSENENIHILTERIVINRIDATKSGYHIGAMFVNKLSSSLTRYIQLLSARVFVSYK